jgi:hypothetical protein
MTKCNKNIDTCPFSEEPAGHEADGQRQTDYTYRFRRGAWYAIGRDGTRQRSPEC